MGNMAYIFFIVWGGSGGWVFFFDELGEQQRLGGRIQRCTTCHRKTDRESERKIGRKMTRGRGRKKNKKQKTKSKKQT
jgi:hypothetical protein